MIGAEVTGLVPLGGVPTGFTGVTGFVGVPTGFSFAGTLGVWHVVTGAAWPLLQEYPIGVLGL
jgi:hypothetical protein